MPKRYSGVELTIINHTNICRKIILWREAKMEIGENRKNYIMEVAKWRILKERKFREISHLKFVTYSNKGNFETLIISHQKVKSYL